eukprot:jgi/Galph1/5686/GphlegSOOS_G4400.1
MENGTLGRVTSPSQEHKKNEITLDKNLSRPLGEGHGLSLHSWETEGDTVCNICFEKFTVSNNHYICCLACGHIFGFTCITKWLKSRSVCPSCNQKAKKKDIRRIYLPSSSVILQDSGEVDDLKQQLTQQLEKNNLQANELALTKRNRDELQSCLMNLSQKYQKLKEEYDALTMHFPFKFIKGIPIQHARAFDFGDGTSVYCGHRKAENGNTFDYLERISYCNDHRITSQHAIYQSTIRDIRYLSPLESTCASHGLLLTCSGDPFLKVISSHNMNEVLCFPLETGAWSCAWSSDGLYMSCGLKNGTLNIFDIRQTKRAILSVALSCPLGIHSMKWSRNDTLMASSVEGVYYVSSPDTCFHEESISSCQLIRQGPIYSTCLNRSYSSTTSRAIFDDILFVSYRSCSCPTRHIVYGVKNFMFYHHQRELPAPQTMIGGLNSLLLSRTLLAACREHSYFIASDERFTGNAFCWESSMNAPFICKERMKAFDGHFLFVIPRTYMIFAVMMVWLILRVVNTC